MLSSAAVRDHLPYPADMSGARTAKHHDNVLCYSGFFVAQCSFTSIAPRPPCSCFSFGRGKSIRQVGFQVKQPSTALIQQIKRHQATSSDVKRRQATSSDVKRRQATQPGRSDRSDRSDITQEVFLWFAFGLVACSDVLKCWMQCRCRHGCEILFVLQFVSALFYFLHEKKKKKYYCTFIIFYYFV